MNKANAQAIAQRFGKFLEQLKNSGLTAHEIAGLINGRAEARGMKVRVQARSVGQLQILDAHIDIADAQLLLQPPPGAKQADDCPGPHLMCPACNEQALCLLPELLAKVGIARREDLPKDGVCFHCGSYLIMVRDREPWSFRLMTEEEIIGLSDDDRIRLQRGRSKVEQSNPSARRN